MPIDPNPKMPDAKAPTPRESTPDYTDKQKSIMGSTAQTASALLVAVARLKQCNQLLTQSGGNFADAVFASGQFMYMDSYHANVLLQQAAPAIDAFLDTNIEGDTALPTYREILQMAVAQPY